MYDTTESTSTLRPTGLRCEYLVNPLGIDALQPRLSWIVESEENGQAHWITGGHFDTSPRLRREFALRGPVASARLYLCGQGLYEASLNGQPVSDQVRGPTLSYFASTFGPEVWFFAEWQTTYAASLATCGDRFLGGCVYDLGRHISGWVEVRLTGPQGDWVCLFGLDCYRLQGVPGETVRLHFAHRAVRYVPVFFFGAGPEPEVLSVRGLDIGSDVESVGRFACSDPALTEVATVVKRTVEAHLLSGMFMDSWQERFGTFMPAEAAVYGWGLGALCGKLARDSRDQQRPDGWAGMYGAPISLDYPAPKKSLAYLPWLAYVFYGDQGCHAQALALEIAPPELVGKVAGELVRDILPDPEHPGFRRFVIRPQIAPGLAWAEAEYRSVRGLIVCRWRRDGNRLILEVVVPANTEALVHVPGESARVLPAGGTAPVQGTRTGPDGTVFGVPGGTYVFEATL